MLIDSKCMEILIDKLCSELGADVPSSHQGEGEEFERAKKAIKLVVVLSGVMPGNFGTSEVLSQLMTLLEHSDQDVGECGSWERWKML